jgi:hypothetical protein
LNIRFYIPGILWLLAMGLLFFTPQSDPPHLFFELIPSRAVLHGILFLGFVHIWVGACKKQLKRDTIRRNAFWIVFAVSTGLAIVSETLVYLIGINPYFSFWNFLFDLIGSCLGILTFKLLYRECY